MPLRQRNLCREMGTAAEAVDTQRTTGWHCRTNQRPVADDAGAEQRSKVLIVDACRQGVSERLVNEAEVGVAAVRVPSGKSRRDAEILCTAAAKPAASVGAAKTRDTHPVTDRKPPR